MKVRKKLDRIFALLLVFTLIFNSQATALLAMEGEPVTEIAGSEVTPLAETEGEQEIIDDNIVVIPDGEAAGDPAEPVTQPEAAQGSDLVLDEESVPGSDSTSGQGDDSLTGQENAGENVAGTQELEPEPESKTEQPADAEPEIGQADPSVSEQENGQENLSGSVTEDGTGADEESGPAVDVESDSDITIVEEETEPQTLELGTDTQELEEVETEEEYEAEVVAMGLDDGIMLTGLDDTEEKEAQVLDALGNIDGLYDTFADAVKAAEDGQTVQLLRDTAEINEKIEIKDKFISIDLAEKTVKFASKVSKSIFDDANGPWLVVSSGSLTIKGSGNIVGGFCQEFKANMDTVVITKTIGISAGGSLSVEDQVNVDYIVNKGTTEIKDNAQVGEIRQLDGTFTLNNELNTSMDVVLGAEDAYAKNAKCLEIGTKFGISEAARMNISFFSTGSSSPSLSSGYNNGKKVIEANQQGWLKTIPSDGGLLTLLSPKEGVSDELLNNLVKIIRMNIVEGTKKEVKRDENGDIVYEDLVIGDKVFPHQQVQIERIITADIIVASNGVVLWGHFRDKDEFVDEKCVYIGNKGNDKNSGYNSNTAVKTIERAIELLQKADVKKICFLDTLVIKDSQTWDLEGITLERDSEYIDSSYVEVMEGGSLTLKNIIFDGGSALSPAVIAKAPLIKVEGGTLNIEEGVTLKNNNFNYSNYNSIGGAIYNNGGAVTMTGGTIEKCKAYNGGAIYCDGGTFNMSSGKLNGNSAWEAGGAVMLANGAKMTLSGNAEISENNVYVVEHGGSGKGYGGGIAVGGYRATSVRETPSLEMTGGTLSHNKALSCGGGIFVQANATASVTGGVIYWNTADGDYVAGGGIYVNGARTEILDDDGTEGTSYPEGYLELKNALINGNIAKGGYGGGGLAACGTASAEISLLNGAAIYGNKKGEMPADYTESDIYIIRDIWSAHTEIDISEYMINGQPYLWKNYDDRTDSAASRLHKNDEIYPYHLYTDRTCIVDPSAFDVKIIGNFSGGSGGGVGANGSVKIGTETDVTSIGVRKVWDESGRDQKKIDSPDQIKVWLLRRKKGDSTFEQVIADYLKPNAKGEWGTITFTNQPIKSPEGVDYEYTVEEDMEGLDVYESSVERDEAAEGENNWIITNTYTPTPTTATITGTKVLTGREWADTDKFTFELTETTEPKIGETAVPDKLTEKTATATSAKKDFSFGPFTYTKPYVHTYTVRETSKSNKGITVDEKTYKVTVNVTDDGNGKLSAEVSYSQKEKNAEGKDTEIPAKKLTFTNTYIPAPTTATIAGTKVLTGREWTDDDTFTFELEETTKPKTGETAVPDKLAGPLTATATSAKKDFSFGPFTYTKPYVHTYTVRETSKSDKGITVDENTYKVTVNVTDDGSGKLSAEVSYPQKEKDAEGKDTEILAKKLTFTNTYTPAPTTATIAGTKILTGREWKDSDEFTFTLTETTEPKTGETVVPDKLTEKTATATSAKKDFSFGPFTYTKPYVHTYTVRETSRSDKGITVDENTYKVTVTVSDDGSGELSAAVSYPQTKKNAEGEDVAEDKVIFTNTYTAASCEATVSATKKLTGRANGLQDKEFSFSLTPVSAVAADGKTEITDPNMDAEMNPGGMLTASNDGDGNVIFEKLTYTQDGTYTYELKEEATTEAGITKDPSVYTVTVSVTDDSLGNLHADVKYSKDGKEVAAADVAFENVYDAEDTSIRLGATKAFDRELIDGEFTFVLQEVDQDGHAVADGITRDATNSKDGSVLFDPIPYDKEGTYYYQISETAGNDSTVLAYDAAVYTVTVTVKDVDAKLVATADLSPDKVTFTNTSTKAYLDKQDAETGAGIPGAVLRIVDKSNGAAVEEWTSDGKPHEVLGKLSKNGSYALEEVSAPDGYMPTGPVDFTMNDKGEIVVDGQITDTVVMKDTKNTISLLKLDEAGQPLPGAHLVIEDATGTAVDNWVSDGTPHVTRGLARGHYVMSEVEAPAGYHVSEDVPFEITGNETQPVEVQMTDTKIPERDNNKLTVMKHLQLDGITCDIGIHDAVFYVALFDDEAKTHRVSDVKTLTFKDSAISTAEFENLGKGTYYLGETDENGVLKESEVVNDRVIYYAQYGENAKVEFEGRKGEATSELTNVYVEVPEEGFYLSGRLTITKKVLLNGTEATSEDTFYARVFSDAALTSPNSDVVALAMNGGSTASVTVYDLPIGETLESSATYYVAETDKNGTPLDPDAVTEYRISIDKSEIVLNAENSNQEVTITNDFIEEEDETETETDLPDEPGATPSSGTSAPKTGDETNLLLYLFYMMLSAGLFAAAAGEKRRRRNRVKK